MRKEITYGQMIDLGRIEDKIKKHVNEVYPELGYGRPKCILGKYGRELSETSLKKIIKLASVKKDTALYILLAELLTYKINIGM
jgi:methionine synthase II (cobalamin-independent)